MTGYLILQEKASKPVVQYEWIMTISFQNESPTICIPITGMEIIRPIRGLSEGEIKLHLDVDRAFQQGIPGHFLSVQQLFSLVNTRDRCFVVKSNNEPQYHEKTRTFSWHFSTNYYGIEKA